MGLLKSLRSWLGWTNVGNWKDFMKISKSGVTVSKDRALGNTAVLRSIALISETIAQVPLQVFDEKTKKPHKKKSLYRVLSLEPNKLMNSFSFWEMMINWAIADGNAFAEIERNGGGDIVGLWPWRPDRVRVYKDEKIDLWYEYTSDDGKQATVPGRDMLHIVGAFPNGIFGQSLIVLAREAIGLAVGAEEYGASWFGNGGKPDAALTTDAKLKPETVEVLIKQWKNRQVDKVLILEQGLKYQPFSASPNESQFIETRKFQISEISRIFGVPPHMLGDLERATFSNIEHQGIQCVTYTFMPWMKRAEKEMERKLLNDTEKDTLSIRFNVDGLLRGDMKSRYEAYAVGRNNGFLSVNDVREKEDWPPIYGGDTYVIPVNTMPAELMAPFWQSKIDGNQVKNAKNSVDSGAGEGVTE